MVSFCFFLSPDFSAGAGRAILILFLQEFKFYRSLMDEWTCQAFRDSKNCFNIFNMYLLHIILIEIINICNVFTFNKINYKIETSLIIMDNKIQRLTILD